MKKQTRLNPVIVKRIGYNESMTDSFVTHFWALCNDGNVWYIGLRFISNEGDYQNFMNHLENKRITLYENQ